MPTSIPLFRRPAVAALILCLAILSPALFSQEKKKSAAKPATAAKKPPATPPIHKVKAGLFEIKVELQGTFEATSTTAIALDTKAWSDLTVLEAVSHGKVVKKGDVIAKFDDEKLQKAIKELKDNAPLADLILATGDAQLAALEKTTPLTLENSKRDRMQAEENLAYYEKVTLPIKKRDVAESLKRSEQRLSYAEEELRQLKKMYEADDLTEETEEIILTRSQNEVDSVQWSLERSQTYAERTLDTTIPREHEMQKYGWEIKQITSDAADKATRDALQKKQLEVAKAHRAHEKAAEKLADMEADLKLLTVTAPRDGIIYYGASVRGKWVSGAAIGKKLIPNGKIAPKEIFITIVDPAKQQIRVSVPESKLKDLKTGLEGTAHPAWNADVKLKTKIASLSYIPFSDRTFDTIFTAPENAGDRIFPGMGAKIALEIYKKEKALSVPKTAVKKEGDGHFVTLKDGKKQKVKVGKSNTTMTEILEGLKAGDEVKTK